MECTIASERNLISTTGGSVRYLHLRLRAPLAEDDSPRPALDVALVLDRSGSMSGNKWRRACEAASQLARRLSPRDRLAAVVFDDQVDTALKITTGGRSLVAALTEALNRFEPRGATSLSDGWLTGCGLVGDADDEQRLRRCFLMTDGQANHGITEPAELAHHAQELARRGVRTSTFGIGDDFDEALLGPLADAGGGAFFDIAQASGIAKALDRELGETLAVVERSVTLTVHGTHMDIACLGSWPCRNEDSSTILELGDLVSDQELDIFLRVTCPSGTVGDAAALSVSLSSSAGLIAEQGWQWTWAEPRLNRKQRRNRAVDRLIAQCYANLARREAALRNRDGDLEGSAGALESVADRIHTYAGRDPELMQLIHQLRAEAEERRDHHLDAREAKTVFSEMSLELRCQESDGSRRRSRRQA